MQITMDKYKTSELGQALKKVYRGKMTVEESVKLAEREIEEVFEKKNDEVFRRESETGFFGDVVAKCPLCGRDVKRFRTFYGCTGYREGCKLSIPTVLCSRTISLSMLEELIEKGTLPTVQNFVSPRTGKHFDAALKLEGGRVVFDFKTRDDHRTRGGSEAPVVGEEIPLPEPPPEY